MSSTVRSYGFIAVLLKPYPDPEGREEMNEKLWEEKSDIRIGYSGELLIIDFNENVPYSAREDFYGLTIGSAGQDPKNFIEEAADRGLFIALTTIQPYNCIWHNGSDNPTHELTKEEFLAWGKP